MKILYVTTIADTVLAFLIPHIKSLIEMGHEVGVACNNVRLIESELNQLKCEVHQVEFQRNPFSRENVKAYKRIGHIVKNEGYDAVHVHTPVASFITRFACRKMKSLKMIYTAHGFHFFNGAPKKNWFIYYTLEKLAARWTDCLITMNDEDYSSAQKLEVRKHNAIFKVKGVGLDLKKFKPQTKQVKEKLRAEYGFDNSEFIIAYVAELSYRKQQDHLIKAVHLLKNKIPNIKLILVGDGELKAQYESMIQKLGVDRNVELLGYREDIPNILVLSDLVVSTSRQEGLPVNIMEAMATGLPVIVTDCRGNKDLVINEKNGYVVGVHDYIASAKAIERLYGSAELRSKFARENLKMIEDYSIEKILVELGEIYSNLLGSKYPIKIEKNVWFITK